MSIPWWTFTKGGAEYLLAARQDDATRRHITRRCSTCQNLQVYAEEDLPPLAAAAFAAYKIVGADMPYQPYSAWCGEPGRKTAGGPCGCLVMAEAPHGETVDVTVQGRPMRGAARADSVGYHCPLAEPVW